MARRRRVPCKSRSLRVTRLATSHAKAQELAVSGQIDLKRVGSVRSLDG